MAVVYLTTTNLDLTEGRGTNRPCLISAHLPAAIVQSEKLGVMGTSSGVSIYEFDTDIDEPVDPDSNHSLYPSRKRVAGGYVDGTGWHRWGLIPERIERLTRDEQTRLEALRKSLGDDLPHRDEPGMNPRAPRVRSVLVIWSKFPASVAMTKTTTGQIIAIRCLPKNQDNGERWAKSVIAEVRGSGYEGAIYATWLEVGKTFRLNAEEADYIDSPAPASGAEQIQREALLEEYTALARKAGIL